MGGSVVSLWYAAAAGCTVWICYTDIRRCWIADAPVLALDMQQVRQRCVGNNQSNGRWKLVLEEKRYVLQEGYIRVKERPYPPGLQVTKGDVRFAVDGRPQHTMAVVITSPDGAYTRSIVVAAQTGRIRIA